MWFPSTEYLHPFLVLPPQGSPRSCLIPSPERRQKSPSPITDRHRSRSLFRWLPPLPASLRPVKSVAVKSRRSMWRMAQQTRPRTLQKSAPTFRFTRQGKATSPAGIDGKVNSSPPPKPLLDVSVTIGGIPATVQYAGGVAGQIAGLMQINVQIPNGVAAGGYVPVVVRIGGASSALDATWIAISENLE